MLRIYIYIYIKSNELLITDYQFDYSEQFGRDVVTRLIIRDTNAQNAVCIGMYSSKACYIILCNCHYFENRCRKYDACPWNVAIRFQPTAIVLQSVRRNVPSFCARGPPSFPAPRRIYACIWKTKWYTVAKTGWPIYRRVRSGPTFVTLSEYGILYGTLRVTYMGHWTRGGARLEIYTGSTIGTGNFGRWTEIIP